MTDAQMAFGGPVPPRPGTAQRRVLDLLLGRPWVCGQEFNDEVGWAFGSRISELRGRGFHVEKRRCAHPRHGHDALVYQYGIVDE